MLKLFVFSSLAVSSLAQAASFSVTGNDRFGTSLFNNLDLRSGHRPGVGDTSAFIEHKFTLRPDVVVDDRFTVRSEFVLAPMGTYNDQPEQMGTALGNGGGLFMTKAYLDWSSDWGILSVGRMSKEWGLGLLYDGGGDVFDDYQTLRDRVSFRGLVGNLSLQVAYEKINEGKLNDAGDDADGYEISVEYLNPETSFDVGLLYTRTVRMASAPAGVFNSNDLSVFTRRRWNKVQFGGEFVYRNPGLGALAQLDYQPGAWIWGIDAGFASGSATRPFAFNPNYRPFLILFNQSVGKADGTDVRGGNGGASAVGTTIGGGTGNGALIGKLSGSYGFDNDTLRFGMDVGFATLARVGTNSSRMLGIETDLNLTQKWYDNFKTVYAAGFLFPGGGFSSNAQVAWGVQLRGALSF